MPDIKPLSTTAIGSVPYAEVSEAVRALSALDIPAYPQMVKTFDIPA